MQWTNCAWTQNKTRNATQTQGRLAGLWWSNNKKVSSSLVFLKTQRRLSENNFHHNWRQQRLLSTLAFNRKTIAKKQSRTSNSLFWKILPLLCHGQVSICTTPNVMYGILLGSYLWVHRYLWKDNPKPFWNWEFEFFTIQELYPHLRTHTILNSFLLCRTKVWYFKGSNYFVCTISCSSNTAYFLDTYFT